MEWSLMCGQLEIGCQIKEGFISVATSSLDSLLQQASQAALDSMHSMATLWLKVPDATIATESGAGWKNSGPVEYLQQSTFAVVAAIFTVAILIAGLRTAWEQRAKPLQELLKAMMTFVLVCGAGAAVLQLLSEWSDGLAHDIVTKAAGGNVDAGFQSIVANGGFTEIGVASGQVILAICVTISVMCASVIQIVLLLIRSAMLVILAGTFPLAAAATNTEVGRTWFRKFCGWAIAFIAYKPAAALIYAAAMKLNQSAMLPSDNQLVQAMTGIMMLMLAVFALPALLRFAVPLTAAVAGGSAAMGSAVADPGGLATGAVNVGRARLGGSGGGSGAGAGAGVGGGAGGGAGAGAGASGARTVGAAASAGMGAAGAAITAARKAGGAVAGAASHSAGDGGGGGGTPSSFGPSGGGGAPSSFGPSGAGGGGSGGGGGSRGGSSGGGASSGRGGHGGGGARGGGGGGGDGGGSYGGLSGGGPSGASGGSWGGGPSGASGGSWGGGPSGASGGSSARSSRTCATSGAGSSEYDGPSGGW
ncbi:type IV secretion system protein [Kribbella sp. NPDC056345]|uniref:type IV secretion system protein n=1 Tax=Kribbella sp. NPDC056345 TaxID=3345789 RepID=UPI0035D56D07